MLESYKEKRDFERTPEPQPEARRPAAGSLKFVVQKHAARRLHYDVRLEVDGVLKSWPVPKGPSLDPEEKRLAVMVEDHPLDYAAFEGVIPRGSYGAGQMVVWDSGVYSPDEDGRLSFGDRQESEERMRQGLEAGKLSFTLRGRKLRGSWTLVRTTRGDNEWLLIKHRDEYADPSRDVLEDGRSVVSGLTIADLKAGRLPDPSRRAVSIESLDSTGEPAEFPSKMKPMMARLSDEPFSHPDWVFEPKLDGFRALAFLRGGEVTLRSRTGNDLTGHFPEIAEVLTGQPASELVLDGELVALNESGLPDFGLIQQRMGLPKKIKPSRPDEKATISYYPFDLLYAEGRDLRRLPLIERKVLLEQVLLTGDSVQLVEYVEEKGKSFFEAAVKLGLEGMVAKRGDSRYEAGARSPSWLKIKHVRSQEFVVAGHTEGTGARSSTFGALVLGYYEGDNLRYAGRVGSGFDQSTLEQFLKLLTELRVESPLLEDHPGLGEKETRWVRPELVVEVKFTEWTHEDLLRAPVFMRLRPETDPRSVVRETAEAAISSGTAGGAGQDGDDQALVSEVLAELSGTDDELALEVGGHRIRLSNLNKELWPAADGHHPITKRDMIRYYVRMGPCCPPPSPGQAVDPHQIPRRD